MPVYVPNTSAPTHLGRFRGAPQDPTVAAVLGVPFCIDEFGPQARLVVEAAFGADIHGDPYFWTWYDITGDVRYADGGRVSITPMGRSDETSTAQPAGCAFVLDNIAGDYTAYSTASRWSPHVRRSTPIRVRVNITGRPADWMIRFQGYATGWTPAWDESANVAVVGVSAQGITRRLQQGTTPLKAALTRAILAAEPTAIWVMDEASDADRIASGLSGGPAMTFTDGIDFAEYTDLGGVGRTPDIRTGSAHGVVASLAPANADMAFTVGFALKTLSVPLSDPLSYVPMVSFNTGGNYYRWDVTLLVSSLEEITFASKSSAEIDTTYGFNISPATLFDGHWHYFEFGVSLAASTNLFTVSCAIDGVLVGSTPHTAGATVSTSGVTSVDVNPYQEDFGTFGLAGLYVINGVASVGEAGAAFDGYDGETPTARLARLCAEERVRVQVAGTSTTTMGPQPTGTFTALIRECETAEQGVLYDGLGPGLTFVTHSARYNLTADLTADAAADQLDYPFSPVDDDQRNTNKAEAKRGSGSSAFSDDELGELGWRAIGNYDTSITVNVQSDSSLLDYAGWLVHLGTQPGFRYPSLHLDLRASPELAPAWLACRVSSRIDVTNLSSVATQHPTGTVALLLEGWTESLSPLDWIVQGNTSQYAGWQVGVLDDPSYVLDCGKTATATDLDLAQTSINVHITDECTWTHADGDYTILINEEEMTTTGVSAASGSGSAWTQTLTVTRGANGTPPQVHPIGSAVHVVDREAFVLAL